MIISKKAIIFGGLLLLCHLLLPFNGIAQSRTTRQTREEYIERYKAIAIDQMERYGIPASITMAQGILESDSGNSTLSRSSNNHFGIKCKRNWGGRKFLDQQPRYDSLFRYAADDYRSWARGLKACGYATAPDYAERLVKIIEESQLYLLDRPNGDALYAQHRHEQKNPDEWFSSQSSTVEHATTSGIDPDNYRVTINAHEGYNIYETNGVHYVLAKADDTFENIASAFRLSARNLRKFNDLKDQKAQPMTDEVIYIERKRNRWEGPARQHICREGDTAYAIGQTYAIRTRRIEKMNHLAKGEALETGRTLRIQ
ncbi:MAG: glucosaminidase domain-containing protein [Planctomycetia bacterium]|nr:glucosaminidase domain-containing protein [Planctomycetia bacterium]